VVSAAAGGALKLGAVALILALLGGETALAPLAFAAALTAILSVFAFAQRTLWPVSS
jgi:hypothetical protein